MISRIFQSNKKLCIILSTILSFCLISLYLYAACLPGIWHRDTFLYRQNDGSFLGKNIHSEYEMHITKDTSDTIISFRVNNTVRSYRISRNDEDGFVEVFENDVSVFVGRAVTSGDLWLLLDEDEGLSDFVITTTSIDDYFSVPDDNDQFPSYTSVYNYAFRADTDTRGNFPMMFYALLIAIFLAIDIKYPDLFFLLKHRLHVDGGSPSDFYRFGQKAGRVISVIAIIGFVIATFTVH